MAQCQDLDVAAQLENGIRYIDIRLKLDGDELRVYHGPCFCGHTFHEILEICAAFLRSHPSEAIVIEIHREDSGFSTRRTISDASFMAVVNSTLEQYRELIADLDSASPLVREVRQKLILVSFKHIENSQNLLNFRIFPVCKNWQSYRCRSTATGKCVKLMTFQQGMRDSLVSDVLYVNEANAIGSVPILSFLPNPRRMAEEINGEIEKLIERADFHGVVQMDFPTCTAAHSIIEKIIRLNFV
jgi:hypothetical protein